MKSVKSAVTGTYHSLIGLPCQDAVFSMPYAAVLCDGAGSVEHSERIAKAIAWHFVTAFNDDFDKWYSMSDRKLRDTIHAEAAELARKYLNAGADCTFLAFAEKDGRNFMIHVGDGYIFGIDEEPKVLSCPENGEELHITYFLSTHSHKDHIRVMHDLDHGYHTLIMCSDGAGEALFNRRDNTCARAVMIMSGWMDREDLSEIKEKLDNSLDNVFRTQSNDDMSICMIRRDPYEAAESSENIYSKDVFPGIEF